MLLGVFGESEAVALVGVIAYQQCHVVVVACFVHLVLVVGNHIAIDNGPCTTGDDRLSAQVGGGECTQGFGSRGVHGVGVFLAFLLRLCQRLHVLAGICLFADGTERTAALRDGTAEQSLGQGRRTQHADGDAARRFAEDGHLGRVATECGDVVLYPFERGNLVEDAIVARHVFGILGTQSRMGEETQSAYTVVDGDEHNALAGYRGTIVVRGGAHGKTAAIDPDHHG